MIVNACPLAKVVVIVKLPGVAAEVKKIVLVPVVRSSGVDAEAKAVVTLAVGLPVNPETV